jgi:deoxyribodipyrimidine photo-lyase
MYKFSIFIFRRDLRLDDNLGLLKALSTSQKVIPCFILNPEQIEKNPFKGQPSLNFMFESLEDLNELLERNKSSLFIFKGIPSEIINRIFKEIKIDSIFINREYTPFGIERDFLIQKTCRKLGIHLEEIEDYLLNPTDSVSKKDFKPYKKFTPYYRVARKLPIQSPKKNNFKNYFKGSIKKSLKISDVKNLLDYKFNPLSIKGGRKNALEIFKQLEKFKNYSRDRDFPSNDLTTHLSPHHKFGTISVRESYYAIKEKLGVSHPLITQLYWRDFFTNIGFNFPHVLGKCFYEKYEKLKWENNSKFFNAWKKGLTGFPIVDAGMRELNSTGFMHNRVRMIVASFLCKDLLIDWRKGEKYFAQHLTDYDPLVNNGNWQWAAGTGCDSVPYFRIFNPWLQQKKFDKDGKYIKKWIPELKNLEPKIIHNLHLFFPADLKYPKPIIDHTQRKKLTLKIYKRISISVF